VFRLVSEPAYVSETRTAYDIVAESYAELLRDALDASPWDRAMLGTFAELVGTTGPVGDLGRGPGRLTTVDGSVAKTTAKITGAELIVIDDIGMLPAGQASGRAFYRVVDAAYERRSIAVTSNLHSVSLTAEHTKTPTFGSDHVQWEGVISVDVLRRRLAESWRSAFPRKLRNPRN
jgi:IstB-like ATP binding protein